MAAPWEEYASQAAPPTTAAPQAGPWSDYASPSPAPAAPAKTNTGFGSAFQYGLDAPLGNIATTARLTGFQGTADALSGLTNAPEGYDPASNHIADEFRKGNWLEGASYLPRAAVEQAGGLVGSMALRGAGAAAGGAVAGPMGAAAGAIGAPAIFQALQTLGPVAQARAEADGRKEPNAADWTAAAGAAGLSGLLESVGVSKLTGMGNSFLRGALGPKSFTGTALREGATEGAQSAVQQGAQTAGTQQGLTVDPYQVAADAALGAHTAATVNAPGSVLRTAREGVQGRSAIRAEADNSPEQFASNLRVQEAFKARQQAEKEADTGRKSVTEANTFNGIRTSMTDLMDRFVRSQYDAGETSKDQHEALQRILDVAKTHNKEFSQSEIDEIRSMGLKPQTEQVLLDGLRDLNTVSDAARQNRGSGPIEGAARKLMPVLGAAGGIAGYQLGGIGGALGSLALQQGVAKGARGLDSLLGLQRPEVLRRAAARAAVAKERGITSDPVAPRAQEGIQQAQDWRSTVLDGERRAREMDASILEGQRAQQQAERQAQRDFSTAQAAANRENSFRDRKAASEDRLREQAWNENDRRDAQATRQQAQADRQVDRAMQQAQAEDARRTAQAQQQDARAFEQAHRSAQVEDRRRTAVEAAQTPSSGPIQFVPSDAADFRESAQAAIQRARIRARSSKTLAPQMPNFSGGSSPEAPSAAPAPSSPTVESLAAKTPPGWQAGIVKFVRENHNITDATVKEVRDAIRALPESPEIIDALLSRQKNAPRAVLHAVTNLLLEKRGVDLEGGRGGPEAGLFASGIRNPASYAETVRQAGAAHDSAVAEAGTNTDLANAARDIAGTKGRAEKTAKMEAYLRTVDPAQVAKARAILSRLTGFGK